MLVRWIPRIRKGRNPPMRFRDWFLRSLIVTIIASIIFVITGCGGLGSGGSGGGSGDPLALTRTPVDSQLQLPAGTAVSGAGLEVWSSGGTTTTDATGKSRVTIFNDGPQYVDVRDGSGRLVASAYLSRDARTINATTTAQTLIFVALGGLSQTSEGPKTILEGVPSLPGFNDVVTEVSRQIAANGYVSLATGTLRQEIDEIVNTFLARGGRGTIAEPTSGSGLFLDTTQDLQFTIQNNYLRRMSAQLKRISYTDADGKTVESPGPVNKFEIASPSRYGGLTSTLSQILLGEITWTPTVSPALPIPLFPADAQSTTYELITLGLGGTAGDAYAGLTDAQISELRTTQMKAFFLDVFIPPITNIILPLNGDRIDSFLKYAGGSTLLTDFIAQTTGTLPGLVDLVAEGKLREAVQLIYNSSLTTNSALPFILQLMQQYGEEYGDEALFSGLGDQSEEIAAKLAALGYVDIFFSAIDFGVMVRDTAKSNQVERFLITTTGGGKISLVTDRPLTCVSEPLAVTAVVQNKIQGAVYQYEWRVNDPKFRLDGPNGSTATAPGGVLITSAEAVNLRPVGTETGTVNVSCTVKRKEGQDLISVDSDARDLQVINDPVVTPATAKLDANKTLTLNATLPGQTGVLWKFELADSSFGSIDRTAIGSNPNVIFSSNGKTGSVILRVSPYLTINNEQVKVCTYLKPISIGDREFLAYDWHEAYIDQGHYLEVNLIAYGTLDIEQDPNLLRYELREGERLIRQWNAGTVPQGHDLLVQKIGPLSGSHYINLYGSIMSFVDQPGLSPRMERAQAEVARLKGIVNARLANEPPNITRVFKP